jgi:glutamine cyclotransferase
MKKWLLAAASILLIISISIGAYIVLTNTTSSNKPLNYTYSIVNTYPHDPTAFTEGLVYDNGALYESTGLVGESSLRRVDLETGTVIQRVSLADDFFGEGITIYGDHIIQLTWQSEKGFVYDKTSFNLTEEFNYLGEGWGITHDDSRLIMSNGSATLTFLDPFTLKISGTVQVFDGTTPVTNLNELEYINGDVYANVWFQDRIAIINIQTGQVKGWINLAGLYNVQNADPDNVLNGIAYDSIGQRLFVTGKRWSQLFEIKLIPEG